MTPLNDKAMSSFLPGIEKPSEEFFEPIWKCFERSSETFRVALFFPFGIGSTACNFILITAILTSKKLRYHNEMRIICALSFAEFVEAFATVIGGAYRLFVILTHRTNKTLTPLQCMIMPHAWMWRWSDFASSFMLLCLTLDRLLSVKLPIRYITSGTKYSTRVITFTYTLSLLLSLIAWHRPLTLQAKLSMFCTHVFISPIFYAFSKYTTSCATILSVVLYIPVLYWTKKEFELIKDKLNMTQVDRKRRAQLRMTITIAIQCVSTFFLDATPRAIGILGTLIPAISLEGTKVRARSQCESATGVIFHLCKLNSMIAFCLYYRRNEFIRESIRYILRGKRAETVSSIKPLANVGTSTESRRNAVKPVQSPVICRWAKNAVQSI